MTGAHLRVIVADDQDLVRAGLAAVLDAEPDIEVVGEAGDGARAVALAEALTPDVVVMDVRMPVMDGIDATRRIVTSPAAPRVLVVTTFDDDELVAQAIAAGASGFLLKDAGRAQIADGVRVVAAGDALLAPSVTRRLLARFADGLRPPVAPPTVASLTTREAEVLTLLGRGLTNAEIAAVLVVGEATVKTHVSRVLSKLGLRDRAQAVIAAYESGLVRPGT